MEEGQLLLVIVSYMILYIFNSFIFIAIAESRSHSILELRWSVTKRIVKLQLSVTNYHVLQTAYTCVCQFAQGKRVIYNIFDYSFGNHHNLLNRCK